MTPEIKDPLSVRVEDLPEDFWPNVEDYVTEDETAMDNIFSEKQQRLLTETLYTSWPGPGDNRSFLACANVGLFYKVKHPPVVPDVLLSLDLTAPTEWWPKIQRSYFVWDNGKSPDAIIEIVSNLDGAENAEKRRIYANIGVPYYIIWDPTELLDIGRLTVLMLQGRKYVSVSDPWLPEIGLGLQIWHGSYETGLADWLRWCDRQGNLLATGADQRVQAEQARLQAEQAKFEAMRSKQQADEATQRAEKLLAQLRALGIEPTKE